MGKVTKKLVGIGKVRRCSKGRQKYKREGKKGTINCKKRVESNHRVEYEKEGYSFAKPKSTIMIERQRDSEAGEVDKGGEGTP